MRQPTVQHLQGELLALRCYVAALIQVLPEPYQHRLPAAFGSRAELVRGQLCAAGDAAFEQMAIALAASAAPGLPEVAPGLPPATPCGAS